jgi:hypothetical protein
MSHPYLFPGAVMATAALMVLLIGLYTWRWRAAPGGFYFSLLVIAVAVFAFTNADEALGRHINDMAGLVDIATQYENIDETHTQLEFNEGEDCRVFERLHLSANSENLEDVMLARILHLTEFDWKPGDL